MYTCGTDKQQLRLQKIKELNNILKDTDRNLSTCEEILTSYIQKRSKEKQEEMSRHNELETKMTEILENLKTRLLVE